MDDDECPLLIHNNSGVPADSVKAARLQRFMAWRWKNDAGFRQVIEETIEASYREMLRKLIFGDEKGE